MCVKLNKKNKDKIENTDYINRPLHKINKFTATDVADDHLGDDHLPDAA